MANWKKLIYSGSDAFVNDISASSMHLAGIGDVSTSIAIATAGTIWQTDTNGVSLINGESNVGIGDVSQANYKLDVSGSIRINKLTDTAIRIAGGGNSDRTLLRVDSEVGATDFSQYGFSVKYMGSRSGNDNSFSIFADNQTETATEAFTILQDGKIGIGTAAPSNLLQLHEAGNSDAQLYIYATGSDGNENAAGIKLFAHNNYTQEAFVKIDDDGLQIGTTNNEPIRFFTDNTIESLRLVHGASGESANVIFHPADTTLFISQSGKVGIGTDDPFLPLHVNGNARIEGYLMTGNAAATNTPAAPLHIKNSGTAFIRLEDLDAGNSIYDISVDQGNGFSILEDSNTRLFIEEGGNVGIAASNPGTTLEVRSPYVSGDITGSVIGTYQLAVVGNGVDGIQLLGGNTAEVRVVFGDKDDGNIGQIAYDNATDNMKFVTDTEERMVITDTGEVGIGASVPARQLHVKDSAETVAVKIEAPDGSQASIDLENSEGAFRIVNDGGALDFHDDAGSNTSRMYIRSGSGNVGIGTKTPQRTLDVNGDIQNNGILRRGGNVFIKSTGSETMIGPAGSGIITFHNSATMTTSDETMRIDSSGNVGIGYNNPYKKLHLHNPTDSGTPDCQMNFTTGVTGAGDGNGFRVGWNGAVANMYLFENADIRFATSNSERMRIKADGKIGIGNPEPPKALTVQGTISASGDLNIAGDAAIDGDLGIGGSIFGLSGFGVTIDDIAVTSGSTNFGSGSNPAESIHSRTGSMSITGSTFTFNGENVLTNASEIYWHDTGTQITSSKSVGISGSVHVHGDITASTLSIRPSFPSDFPAVDFTYSQSIADGGEFNFFPHLEFGGGNARIGRLDIRNGATPIQGIELQAPGNGGQLILGNMAGNSTNNIIIGNGFDTDAAASRIAYKAPQHAFTNTVATVMELTESIVYISDSRITGSLEGTASYAVTASHAISASYALSSTSASYALSSTSASYALSSTSASYAMTASYALNAGDNSLWYDGGTFITSSVDTKISGSLTITNANAAQLILRGDSGNVGDAGQIDNIIDLLLDTEAYGYRINTENYAAKTALNIQEKIASSYTSRLYINEDGNVGIGTSSPTSKLHVNGVVTASGVNIKDGTYNNYLNLDRTSHGDINQVIKISPTTPSGGSGLTALQINIGTGQFQFTEQSRLGIGTLNPSTELEVNGDIEASTLALNQNISVAGEVTAPLTFNSSANIIASGSKNHFRNTASSTKFTAYKNVSELAKQNAGGGSITIDPSGIGSGYPINIKADDVGLKIYNGTTADREIHLGRYGGATAASNLTGSLVIKKDGDLRLHAYGAGNQTGTATYTLGVDSSGNVIEFDSISGGDAATLDGTDPTSFLRSDQNDDFSGTLNYTPNTGTILSVDGQAILQRMTTNGALTIGHDDSVIIAGGDTSTVMNTNITNSDEKVFIGAEGGLVVHAFPGNDTAWSNRKSMIFNGTDLQVLGNRVLTTADEGTGNGLDADTVDSIHASSFLRSDADATFTGTIDGPRLRLTSTTDASATSTNHALQIGPTNSSNVIFDANEIMARNNGAVATLNLNPDGGAVTINSNTGEASFTIGGHTVWHAGNDGASSGLDADTLDGQHASAFLTSIGAGSIGDNELAYNTGQHLDQNATPTFHNLTIDSDSADEDQLLIKYDDEFYLEIRHRGHFDLYGANDFRFKHAGTTRLAIKESNGNVGIGTTSPANILDIRHDGSDGNNGVMIVRSDTTTSTGEQLGGIGFDSTDGNVPSSILEASAYIAAFAGQNHSFTKKGGYLTFGVTEQNDNDDTQSTEVVRIAMNKKVHFKDDIVAFSSTVSDMRLKTDIQLLTGSLDTICNLEGVRYNWKYRDTGPQLGVIAQQVEPYVPEIIKETELPLHAKEQTDTTKYKTVQYEQLVPHLIEAIKELKAEVDELKSRLTDAE